MRVIAALPLVRTLVADTACRERIASYLELAGVMLKTLVAHLNNATYFSLAADCLLGAAADPRLHAELRAATSSEVTYKKRSLLSRLEADAKGGGHRPALVDKQRTQRLVCLLR